MRSAAAVVGTTTSVVPPCRDVFASAARRNDCAISGTLTTPARRPARLCSIGPSPNTPVSALYGPAAARAGAGSVSVAVGHLSGH